MVVNSERNPVPISHIAQRRPRPPITAQAAPAYASLSFFAENHAHTAVPRPPTMKAHTQKQIDTPLLPLCYLASGLTMGGAVYAAAQIAMPDEGEMQKAAGSVINRCVAAIAIVQAALFLAFDAVSGFAGDAMLTWDSIT